MSISCKKNAYTKILFDETALHKNNDLFHFEIKSYFLIEPTSFAIMPNIIFTQCVSKRLHFYT